MILIIFYIDYNIIRLYNKIFIQYFGFMSFGLHHPEVVIPVFSG